MKEGDRRRGEKETDRGGRRGRENEATTKKLRLLNQELCQRT
jgi:hypothetical protein